MNFIADGRFGAIVATGTTGAGTATWMSWIPEDIGKIATLAGILLSLVLIVVHLNKMRYDSKKARLEIEQLQWKIDQERKLTGSQNSNPAQVLPLSD